MDSDKNALQYARGLLADRDVGDSHFLAENAYEFTDASRNVERFGRFSTVYSAGLFDYISDARLVTLLRALYSSLAPDGVFIVPFKDSRRYETFDYHWVVEWHHFHQRDELQFRDVFRAAGVPSEAITVSRDPSVVLLFFTIRAV